MIHLVLLRSTGEACQNINQGLDQDFRSVTECLTQLETWQQSANHGWLIFPHLHLPAPQEMLFLHWVKVSVLEGTCRKIHHGAVASQKSPCSVLARWDCVVGVPVRARSVPQAFCTDLPSFPRNQGHSSSFSYLCKVLKDGKIIASVAGGRGTTCIKLLFC